MRRLAVLTAAGFLVGVLTFHRTAWALVRYAMPSGKLLVPVQGVERRALRSSWGEPRSGRRKHAGIDIFARRGTPIVAAAAGEVIRIGTTDKLGGNTVWVAGSGARLYYYAHLDHFRPGLSVGESVSAGTRLGFVGTTGNARGTPPHLHFGVYPALRAFAPVDPTPLLR
jgi:murein DD-endopeptidase MepM/ murein hydrolase activator NlpD